MSRNRSAGIIIKDKKILLMHRINNGNEYYSFPGGGQEPGETVQDTAVRELNEETSVIVQPKKLLYNIVWDSGDRNYFYLCDYVSGEAHLREDSEEFELMQHSRQVYDPVWVDIDKLPNLKLYQLEIRDLIVEDYKKDFSDGPRELNIKVSERRR